MAGTHCGINLQRPLCNGQKIVSAFLLIDWCWLLGYCVDAVYVDEGQLLVLRVFVSHGSHPSEPPHPVLEEVPYAPSAFWKGF